MTGDAFWEDHRKDMDDPEYRVLWGKTTEELVELQKQYRQLLDADEAPAPCPVCGKPEGTFSCRIRHVHMDTSWAKGDH